ncbi:hypothetical protein Spa11_02120 [Botrimarina mediterranea]|uniref:Uncharacterized protein n=1 Tax=Botrimarina mediterranea TaxID=2528022 RepID=A0A518K2M5_9BACT|nr:hypothetical protein Spa11_02120 [Botrimarina mediterranea]
MKSHLSGFPWRAERPPIDAVKAPCRWRFITPYELAVGEGERSSDAAVADAPPGALRGPVCGVPSPGRLDCRWRVRNLLYDPAMAA